MEDGYTTPYKFTSKEQDPETGLYYYGARYYDARLSRWVLADPAMSTGEYFPKGNRMPRTGMGGVFNTININVYHFSGDNPIKYIDPNGKENIKKNETLADKVLNNPKTVRKIEQMRKKSTLDYS